VRLKAFKREGGGYLVELALVLPLFMAAVLFFMWFGLSLNARSSVISSVNSGVRLAITRGDSILMGEVDLINEIQNWLTPAGGNPPFPVILFSAEFSAQQAMDQYDLWTGNVFPGNNLEDLPPKYLYALAYVYEHMKLSVGEGAVRYPCDPNLSEAQGGGPGCLMCRFLNGGGDQPLGVGEHRVCADDLAECVPPVNELGLECQYSSPRTILQVVNGIIRGAGFEPIIFRHKNYLF